MTFLSVTRRLHPVHIDSSTFKLTIILFSVAYGTLPLNPQSLELGPCRLQGDVFCQTRVTDSICSTEKNECICNHGFVAIQDEQGISCTTLLTDLPCQVDTECVHVHGSMCHPGVGACACPARTIFVPELQACRTPVQNSTRFQCLACEQAHGICFLQSDTDGSHGTKPITSRIRSMSKNMRTTSSYGCRCPDGFATAKQVHPSARSPNFQHHQVIDVREDITTVSMRHTAFVWNESGYCSVRLADIGELCNHVDFLCRSKHSTCKKSSRLAFSNGFPRICACKKEYVPVYQKNLGYHECFPRLSELFGPCSACIRIGGVCYRMEDNRPNLTNCVCPYTWKPIDRRSVRRNPNHLNSEIYVSDACQRELDVLCEEENIRICLKPHSPQIIFALSNGQLNAYVSARVRMRVTEAQCALRQNELNPVEGIPQWCTMIPWSHGNPACGIDGWYDMMGQFNVMGSVLVNFDQLFNHPDLEKMEYRFHCTSSGLNNSSSTYVRYISPTEAHDIVPVTLNVVDKNRLPLTTVSPASEVHLVAFTDGSIHQYGFFNFEECSSTEYSNGVEGETTSLLSWRCPSQIDDTLADLALPRFVNPCETANCLSLEDAKPTSKIIKTNTFPIDGLSLDVTTAISSRPEMKTRKNSNSTLRHGFRISCLIRLCREASWCTQPSWCRNASQSNGKRSTRSPDDFSVTFVTRSVQLLVTERELEKKQKDIQKSISDASCSFHSTWCAIHAVLTTVIIPVVAIVVILLTIIGVLLVRVCKPRASAPHTWKYRQSSVFNPNTIPYLTPTSSASQTQQHLSSVTSLTASNGISPQPSAVTQPVVANNHLPVYFNQLHSYPSGAMKTRQEHFGDIMSSPATMGMTLVEVNRDRSAVQSESKNVTSRLSKDQRIIIPESQLVYLNSNTLEPHQREPFLNAANNFKIHPTCIESRQKSKPLPVHRVCTNTASHRLSTNYYCENPTCARFISTRHGEQVWETKRTKQSNAQPSGDENKSTVVSL